MMPILKFIVLIGFKLDCLDLGDDGAFNSDCTWCQVAESRHVGGYLRSGPSKTVTYFRHKSKSLSLPPEKRENGRTMSNHAFNLVLADNKLGHSIWQKYVLQAK